LRVRVGTVGLGVLFGLPVLVIWWVTRSDVIPFDATAGLVLIALMFVAAGFFGALLGGGFAGGISAGFVAGCVSALVVPGDYVFYHSDPYFLFDVAALVDTMSIAAVAVMFLATAGALLPGLGMHRKRLGRSIQAFVMAWRTIPS
jgi:hypothetical protein